MMHEIRVIPELRSAHVEREARWGNCALVLYGERKYDLESEDLPRIFQPFRWRRLIACLREQKDSVIELPEPLWMRESFRTFAIAVVARTVGGRTTKIVTYCIENSDLDKLFLLGKFGAYVPTTAGRFVFGWAFSAVLSKVVYGSPSAQVLYANLRGFRRVDSRVILELPSASTTLTSSGHSALFVGRLEERKGILEAMTAWSAIEDDFESTFTVIGDGPLRQVVEAWVSERPDSRQYLGAIDHSKLPYLYTSHRVLVAPSKIDGRWKEQIGLPIKEALSHGLTICASGDTGLSEWLADHGHFIQSNGTDYAQLLRSALANPLSPKVVVESLPDRDGRDRAHEWLFET